MMGLPGYLKHGGTSAKQQQCPQEQVKGNKIAHDWKNQPDECCTKAQHQNEFLPFSVLDDAQRYRQQAKH
jgi:hypothetical protein